MFALLFPLLCGYRQTLGQAVFDAVERLKRRSLDVKVTKKAKKEEETKILRAIVQHPQHHGIPPRAALTLPWARAYYQKQVASRPRSKKEKAASYEAYILPMIYARQQRGDSKEMIRREVVAQLQAWGYSAEKAARAVEDRLKKYGNP
jgi:hypothetical protein